MRPLILRDTTDAQNTKHSKWLLSFLLCSPFLLLCILWRVLNNSGCKINESSVKNNHNMSLFSTVSCSTTNYLMLIKRLVASCKCLFIITMKPERCVCESFIYDVCLFVRSTSGGWVVSSCLNCAFKLWDLGYQNTTFSRWGSFSVVHYSYFRELFSSQIVFKLERRVLSELNCLFMLLFHILLRATHLISLLWTIKPLNWNELIWTACFDAASIS